MHDSYNTVGTCLVLDTYWKLVVSAAVPSRYCLPKTLLVCFVKGFFVSYDGIFSVSVVFYDTFIVFVCFLQLFVLVPVSLSNSMLHLSEPPLQICPETDHSLPSSANSVHDQMYIFRHVFSGYVVFVRWSRRSDDCCNTQWDHCMDNQCIKTQNGIIIVTHCTEEQFSSIICSGEP